MSCFTRGCSSRGSSHLTSSFSAIAGSAATASSLVRKIHPALRKASSLTEFSHLACLMNHLSRSKRNLFPKVQYSSPLLGFHGNLIILRCPSSNPIRIGPCLSAYAFSSLAFLFSTLKNPYSVK